MILQFFYSNILKNVRINKKNPKMELVLIPEKTYGNFFEGDCYVLLFTQKVKNALSYDIHYWIGSESSQDEQGAAAVYSVQLDDYLGSSPIQHREVQNHESDTFKGYFKHGIMKKKSHRQGGEPPESYITENEGKHLLETFTFFVVCFSLNCL
uniref:Gelsolin-like domain-containing protein n=1 Tax=Oryzias melastigma TaxID=30732 RepID=A0A3B3CWP0_ORYME